ncbi:PREDICTED: uncharacterized protein LOC109583863 [Amphimedon queenslandica]|nr:PREDICTED: uncharacterized protein LOC109583863 [Amphimedon queenslandica]|eukprot:XP_019854924.1 PREDICTED: uncharacterized protein LOC109583863 [Amphimedon queenslandica]
MFSNVRKVISQSPPPLEELKTFIEDFNFDLEAELSLIKNQESVMRLIRKNCSLINIVILEAVVEHFEIHNAQIYIYDYKREIKEFCRNLSVDLCLNEPFDVVRTSPPLKCETATYVLGWEATEHKLKDVTDIVSKSSGKFVKLINIKSTQSITITCSFPHSLTEALIIKLSDNLELLKKNDLMELTVGYCTIWKKQKIQEIQESLEEEVQEIKEQDKDHDKVNKPIAKSVFIARYGYYVIDSVDISFSEGEWLEIYRKDDSFYWKGRSLVSGDEGDIPSSCVYSMLESLQLLEFILSVEEVSLPILQKIRNDSSSNDKKASYFLKTINDDPIMISALRQDKEQHDKGVTGSVDWGFDRVSLTSPSPVQCNEVISSINNNFKEILLHSSSTNSTITILSSTKLSTLNLRTVRRFEIWLTPLTNDCIQYLCILITNNRTIQELDINGHSISDRGVSNICQALEHSSTLTSLDLYHNPLITSTSGQALSHLLLNNSSLVELNLTETSLSAESILLILQSLSNNKNIRILKLDERHEETCINTYPNYHLIQDRVDWWGY